MNQTLTPQTKMLMTVHYFEGRPTTPLLRLYQSQWHPARYSGEGCEALESLILANLVRAVWNSTNDDISGWYVTESGIAALTRLDRLGRCTNTVGPFGPGGCLIMGFLNPQTQSITSKGNQQ